MTSSELIESSNLEFDLNNPYDIDLLVELNELSEKVENKKKLNIFGYRAFTSFGLSFIAASIAELSDFNLIDNNVYLLIYVVLAVSLYAITVDKAVDFMAKRALHKGSAGKLSNTHDFSFVSTKESIIFYQKAKEHKNKQTVHKYLNDILGRGLTNIEAEGLEQELAREVIVREYTKGACNS